MPTGAERRCRFADAHVLCVHPTIAPQWDCLRADGRFNERLWKWPTTWRAVASSPWPHAVFRWRRRLRDRSHPTDCLSGDSALGIRGVFESRAVGRCLSGGDACAAWRTRGSARAGRALPRRRSRPAIPPGGRQRSGRHSSSSGYALRPDTRAGEFNVPIQILHGTTEPGHNSFFTNSTQRDDELRA